MRDDYHSFADLLLSHHEGADFDRTLLTRQEAKVAILAPQGGRLENHTDTIAESVAGSDFSLYCFRSRLRRVRRTCTLRVTTLTISTVSHSWQGIVGRSRYTVARNMESWFSLGDEIKHWLMI
jgi:hypothetical protein